MKAFPSKGYIQSDEGILGEAQFSGMDLRDYFAAKALQGIVSTVPHLVEIVPMYAAVEAYQYADAMMEARAIIKEITE